MLITENRVTQKGISGIHEHLSHGFLYGYLKEDDQNSSTSRWRPLSLITVSIEISIFGKDKPAYSHLINMLFYILIIVQMFSLLRKFWLNDVWLSFFSSLLFAIHPIHTEAVANIKGRDELLCLLFALISLNYFWKYLTQKKNTDFAISLLCYFISLSAKEGSFTLIAGIPLALYFFTSLIPRKIFLYSASFAGVAIVYLFIRNTITPDIKPSDALMNNAYLYASTAQALATKTYVLLLYLKLLIIPYPLVYDYSYNQIPYLIPDDFRVLSSLSVYGILSLIALYGFKKKKLYSFCIILLFITLSINSNILLNIGVILAERLLFFPSFAICILLAWVGYRLTLFTKAKTGLKPALTATVLILPVLIFSSIITVSRNREWKDDISLNLADVQKNTESARINNGAGSAFITLADQQIENKKAKDSLLLASLPYFQKAWKIDPTYNDVMLNMGAAYYRLDKIEDAERCWNIVRKSNPQHAKLLEYDQYLAYRYLNAGLQSTSHQKLDSSQYYLQKALSYSHQNDSIYWSGLYNLGGVYFTVGDYNKAYETLGKLMKIKPDYENVAQGFKATEDLLLKKQ